MNPEPANPCRHVYVAAADGRCLHCNADCSAELAAAAEALAEAIAKDCP